MKTFTSTYDFGDTVYLRTDENQAKWMVVEISFRPGSIVYYIASGRDTYTAYEFELSDSQDVEMKLGIESDKERLK